MNETLLHRVTEALAEEHVALIRATVPNPPVMCPAACETCALIEAVYQAEAVRQLTKETPCNGTD